MPTIEIDGQTIYFQVYGTGDPLLLMHGWVQVGAEMLPLAERLVAEGFQVIVPDMPGYGRSVPPFRTYPPDMYQRDARLMSGFLDVVADRPVHIMGFSDGGETALLLALYNPARCRSVMVWGALGAFGPEACEASRRGLPPNWITDALRAQHPGQDVDQWPYQWVEAFCALIAAGGDISLSRAADIACPLLLMLGSEDRLNPPAAGRHFVERSARHGVVRLFREFPGAGHGIHEQQPDSFIAAIREFLDLARRNEGTPGGG